MAAAWALAILPAWFPGPIVAEPTTDSRVAEALESLSGARMLADVTRLSSPDFNGRQTGTGGDLLSARLVAERLRSLALVPAGTDAIDPDPHPWGLIEPAAATQIGDVTHLELAVGSTTVVPPVGTGYLPILDSPSVNVTAPVVFVGYGTSDPAKGFDEYEGLDVRNRIVLFIRGTPERYPGFVSHADKVRIAREKGAVAFLTATGPILSAYEARRGFRGEPLALYTTRAAGAERLPGCWISTVLAERILATEGRSLREVQEALNRTLTPRSLVTGTRARLAWDSRETFGPAVTVLGLIPSAAPEGSPARQETVILGAHRDHFGRQAGLLFPGADDNASGTAVLLEVARALARAGLKPMRSMLFISFSGEEPGLLGSRLYVKQPARPLAGTVAMVNVDHAGVGNGRLTVGVTGLPKDPVAQAGMTARVSDKLDLFGFFPGGDHVPFKEAGVPTVTIVSAGVHPHFHQPTDKAETVQPEILEAVARYLLALSWQLANEP